MTNKSNPIETIINSFLGWTTEYLHFILVGDTYALVDADNFNELNQLNWRLQQDNFTRYAITNVKNDGGKWTSVYMHQLILPLPKPLQVDHKNHNGLDNRRINLREATRSQNQANRKNPTTKRKLSKYRGVGKDKQRWRAEITVNGQRRYLGMFLTEQQAALAYNKAAKEFFGEFAWLNQI